MTCSFVTCANRADVDDRSEQARKSRKRKFAPSPTARGPDPDPGKRRSPRKRFSSTCVSLLVCNVNQRWAEATFGPTLAKITYCTARSEIVRDSAPQYQYRVPALTLGAVEFLNDTTVWLTDVGKRNGTDLWNQHGQPSAVYYALPDLDAPPLILCSRSQIARATHPLYPLRTRDDIKKELMNAVSRLTVHKFPGPRNAANSCHLDVFLMSELAFYSAHLANIPDDVSALPQPIQRLLQTLVTLGHFRPNDILNQDVARNAYREYELSKVTLGERQAILGTFHGKTDYVWHGVLLATLTRHGGREDYIQEERMLRRTLTHKCSGDKCDDDEEVFTNVHVPSTRQWYPLRDGLALDNYGNDNISVDGPSHGIAHGSFQSMLMSFLHRGVGETSPCPSCARQRITTKNATGIRFPRSLELDEGQTTQRLPLRSQLEVRLEFGSIKYDLIAVTLQNAGHFTVIVKLGNSWYEYDDLRRNHNEGETQYLPTLTLLGGKAEVYTRLVHLKESSAALCPRTWRYTLDPNSVVDGVHVRWDTNIDVSTYTHADNIGWDEPIVMPDDTIHLKKHTCP